MSLFKTTKVIRRRFATSVPEGGYATDPTETDTVAFGTWQPAGELTKTLEEHERKADSFEFRTGCELRAVSEREQTAADFIVKDDLIYKVVKVLAWQNGLIPHYHAVVQLVGSE